MKWSNIVSAAAAGVLAAGCGITSFGSGIKGSGVEKTEKRSLGAFHAVTFGGFGEITVTRGPSTSVSITTDDNLLSHVKTSVKQGNLSIDMENMSPTRLKIAIVTPNLDAFNLSGAGSVVCKDIDSKEFRLRASGAGSFVLAGKSDSVQLNLSGAGSVEAEELKANSIRAEISGAGSAELGECQQLDVSVSGAGSVTYRGNPKVVQSTSGVGSVSRKG